MTHLAKLTFKTITRSNTADPLIARRDKLVEALQEQKLVFAAALRGQDHFIEKSKKQINDAGETVLVKTKRAVRAWFFEQDAGWYVQCRYGARVIAADGVNNAVFVKTLKDVASVLDAFIAAATAGELDQAITKAAERKTTAAKELPNG